MTAELGPSRIVTGTEIPDGHGAPVLTAHGDPDDHLRLTVLLAQALGASATGGLLREAAETCATPTKVSWAQRLEALSYILEHAPPPEGRPYGVVLVDPDALDTGPLQPDDLWDDRDFRRQRGELLDVVLDAVADGGWLVVRPNPSSKDMRKLEVVVKAAGFVETESTSSAPEEAEPVLGALYEALAPECRPILSWIVRSGKLPEREVQRRFDAGEADGFEEDILGVAYEVIPSHARKAAKRIAALRGGQPSNGMLGPFRLGDDEGPRVIDRAIETALRAGAATLPMQARSVRVLEECGFLQPGPTRDGHKTLRMPRAVRTYLLPLAELGEPEIVELQHLVSGARRLDDLALDAQLETHFHAVQGGDLDDALRTARYYATDLRALAFRLSREEHYTQAAEIYRKIVLEFDPEDAHAWEYFGFNLALASGPDSLLGDRAKEIRHSYVKAFEYDRQNPLYHGRLLGFRARLGEDVRAEVQREMRRYLIKHGDQSKAFGHFVDSVKDWVPLDLPRSFYPAFRALVPTPQESWLQPPLSWRYG